MNKSSKSKEQKSSQDELAVLRQPLLAARRNHSKTVQFFFLSLFKFAPNDHRHHHHHRMIGKATTVPGRQSGSRSVGWVIHSINRPMSSSTHCQHCHHHTSTLHFTLLQHCVSAATNLLLETNRLSSRSLAGDDGRRNE